MTEYEQKLASLPSPGNTTTDERSYNEISEADEEISTAEIIAEEIPSAQNDNITENRPRTVVYLKKSIIFLLTSISTLVFGVSAIVFAVSTPIEGDFITRLMLGEFFGGIDNIREVSSYEVEYNPVTEQPESIENTPQMKPLEAVDKPTAHQSYENGTLELSNETPYELNMEELLAMERVIPPADELYELYGEDAPLVLILHTHGTEAFSDSAANNYRSTDIAKNIVSLGTVIADKLNSSGINTLHSTTMFDEDDFTMAYYNASIEIRKTLEQYPSISYIIDIHRDSIESDGVYIAPATEAPEGSTAQMMFVIGTDYGGSGHTTWRNNLSLAARLQTELNNNTPQLMRSINLRSASFNEQYSDGSLLLEIGACASSHEEVSRSAEKFADALAREILDE